MKKNIIFIQPALPNYRIDFFDRICRAFTDRSFRVYYALSDINYKNASKIDWATCSGKIKNLYFGFFLQPIPNLEIRAGDIVVISGNIRNLSSMRLLFLARLRGASVLWWGHYKSSGGSRFGIFFRTLLMLFSNSIIFYVDSEVDKFRSSLKYICFAPKSYALNNGIDISRVIDLRLDYVFANRDIDFLFIGRLTKKASLDLVLEAISLTNGEFNLHVVGDGALRSLLTKKVESLGLQRKVTWHGEIDDECKISLLMNRSKVFVYGGGVGLSLIHAMAYGLPAIIHSCPSNHMPEFDAFEASVTGIAFERNNVRSLSEAMKYAMNHPVELDRMSKNALLKIGPDFTTEGMAQRFSELIGGLN